MQMICNFYNINPIFDLSFVVVYYILFIMYIDILPQIANILTHKITDKQNYEHKIVNIFTHQFKDVFWVL